MGDGRKPARPVSPDVHQACADERDREADLREVAADERDREADLREVAADERDREADLREVAADERERRQDEREQQQDSRDHMTWAAPDVQKRAFESIERSRAILAATQRRLDRSEAALKRSAAWVERDQADIDRAVMRTERELRRLPIVPDKLTERAAALGKQIAVAAAELASTEEELARVHGELAVRYPARSGEHLRAADEARATARLARETGQRFSVNRHRRSHADERSPSSPDLFERSAAASSDQSLPCTRSDTTWIWLRAPTASLSSAHRPGIYTMRSLPVGFTPHEPG